MSKTTLQLPLLDEDGLPVLRRNGSPVFIVMGAEDDNTGGDDDSDDDSGDDDNDEDDDDAGKPKDGETNDERIARIEAENKELRSKARKEAKARKDATSSSQATIDAVLKALGHKPGDDAPTAEELAKELTTEKGTSAKQARQNAVLLEVMGRDDALNAKMILKLGEFDELDPKDSKAVKKAVDDLIAEYPEVRKTDRPGSSGTPHPGGGKDKGGKPTTLDSAVAAAMSK